MLQIPHRSRKHITFYITRQHMSLYSTYISTEAMEATNFPCVFRSVTFRYRRVDRKYERRYYSITRINSINVEIFTGTIIRITIIQATFPLSVTINNCTSHFSREYRCQSRGHTSSNTFIDVGTCYFMVNIITNLIVSRWLP